MRFLYLDTISDKKIDFAVSTVLVLMVALLQHFAERSQEHAEQTHSFK